jgi:cytochrome c peroxidase
MKTKMVSYVVAALLAGASLAANADADNAEKLAKKYTTIAKTVNASFDAPSSMDGKIFFNRKIKAPNGKEVACASCHTSNPANTGKNIVTGRSIAPLSPLVNAKRFSDLEKVEDKFTEHCNDIIGADCTAAEKANFIAYLLTEEKPTK